MIASCKHPVRGLTKPPAASMLRISSRTLSCLYTSRRCVILLCVSNLRRVPVFSKCSFLWHSAYFHSALYPSFRRKNPHWIFRKLAIHNFPHSAFRKIPLPITGCLRFGFKCSMLISVVYIGNIMRIIYHIDSVIARQLRRRSSSSLFTTARRQHRSAVRQMSNIYRLNTQGTSHVLDDATL